MRRAPAVLIAAAVVAAPAAARAITKEEVLQMARAGVSPAFVAEMVERALLEGAALPLTDAEARELRKAGLPADLIARMRAAAPAPAAAPGGAAPPPAAKPPRAESAAETFRRAEQERRERERERAEQARREAADELRRQASDLARQATEIARAAKEADAQAGRRRTEIDRALRAAFDLLARGRAEEAARRFHEFLRGGLAPPDSHRYVEGEWGLAESLRGAGLVLAAIPHDVEVLRRGPGTRRFAPALLALARAMERVVYDHPILELLAGFDLSGEPPEARDRHAFFLGQFFARFGDAHRARERFQAVSPGSPRYPAARYHLGVLDVAGRRYRTAVDRFREAVVAAEAAGRSDLGDLGHLALGRLALENGAFDGAEFHYRRVPIDSRHAARARYELVWTRFARGDSPGALGALHALSAPSLARAFLPDLGVLEATVYLNLCRYQDARATVEQARDALAPLRDEVRDWLAPREDPGAYLAEIGDLPAPVRRAIEEDLEVAPLLDSARQAAGEIERLAWFEPGPLGDAVGADLRERHALLVRRAGVALHAAARDRLGEIEEMLLRCAEVLFEIDLAEKERLLAETQALAAGGAAAGGAAEARSERQRRAEPRAGGRQLVWRFQGEYWADEVDAYRSLLTDACEPEGR